MIVIVKDLEEIKKHLSDESVRISETLTGIIKDFCKDPTLSSIHFKITQHREIYLVKNGEFASVLEIKNLFNSPYEIDAKKVSSTESHFLKGKTLMERKEFTLFNNRFS
ncbi:MAG: hypothetical protein N4A44_03510 [Alphaproteobacteria bacterium]|jgi:hypothetical protein|nr:hypothetical protein [Alphaproteobacteria bacterium]